MTSYRTPLAAAALHESGWLPLNDDVEINVLPPIDTSQKTPKGRPLFARLDGPATRAFWRQHDARPPLVSEFLELHALASKRGSELKPVILPTAEMRAKVPRYPGETDGAYGRRLYAQMGSLEWCGIHDDLVWDQIEALQAQGILGPYANEGKPEARRVGEKPDHDPPDMCLVGWWIDGHWVQQPNEQADHGNYHTDYSKLGKATRKRRRGCDVSAVATSSPTTAPVPDNSKPRSATKTKATMRMIYNALVAAWPGAIGGEVDHDAVKVLVAQSAIETGNWAKLWNWNLGNVKRTKDHAWMMLGGTWEIVDGKKVVFQPPHPQTHFNAYDSLEQGAPEWLAKMKGRFGKAWPFALAGDAAGFSKALKAQRYYTANEPDYTRELVARMAQIEGELIDVPAALAKLGYSDVKSFQVASKLVPDGIVGPKTRAALNKALGQ